MPAPAAPIQQPVAASNAQAERDAWREAQKQCSAILPVGAIVTDFDGEPHVIERPFDAYRVDGEMRCGYLGRDHKGDKWFYAAGQLLTVDGEPTHLRLIHSASRASGASHG